MENVVKFNINKYIDNGAFCPIDADEDTKEKFLRSIGVFHYDSAPKVNANLTAKHILKHTNIIPLDNYNLAIYNGKFFEIKDAQLIINFIIKKLLNCIGNYWNTRREIEINEAIKRSFDYKVLSMDTECLNTYKKQLNDVGEFFDECFVRKENAKMKKADIYSFYDIYCNVNGNAGISRKEFWKKLKSVFANKNSVFDVRKINGVDYVYGYAKNEKIKFDIPTVGVAQNNEFAIDFP